MDQREIQGSCISCKSRFAIPVSELKDYMTCPECGSDADITVICPHCHEEILTNGLGLGIIAPCFCGKDFIWNTVKSTDGTPMVVSMTGRLEIHDMASILNIMQENLEKNEVPENIDVIVKGKHHLTANNRKIGSKGCLFSIISIISLLASLIAVIFFLI